MNGFNGKTVLAGKGLCDHADVWVSRSISRLVVWTAFLGISVVAYASRHDGVVSRSRDGEPAGYVPVLVANGELAMTVDRTFGIRAEDLPQYSQGVFLAGRARGRSRNPIHDERRRKHLEKSAGISKERV